MLYRTPQATKTATATDLSTDIAIGVVGTIGVAPGAASVARSTLAASAQAIHSEVITVAGRALMKHPELLGYPRAANRMQSQLFPRESQLNEAAAAIINGILTNGRVSITYVTRAQQWSWQFRPENGVGARWGLFSGRFIGFIGQGSERGAQQPATGDVTMVSWDQVGAWFAADSMKVDVFAAPATATTWKRILDVVPNPPYAAELVLNGQPARIWPPVTELFEAVSLLTVRIGGLVFETAFFSPLEIEFWFDGRRMMSASEFECLVLFLKDIANAAGVDVLVTPENTHDRPFLVFRHETGQLEFAPSWRRLQRGTP